MRAVLFVLVGGTVLMWVPFLRTYWHIFRPWWLRCVLVVVFGPWLYVLAGQAKAYDLGPERVPFDLTAWGGVLAFALLDVVLVLSIARKPKIRKG